MNSRESDIRREIAGSRRIVIKIGTKTISDPAGGVDRAYLDGLAQSLKALIEGNRQVLIVSSGAIGMGAATIGLTQKSQDIAVKQACASIGQPLLMEAWRDALGRHELISAQLLITRDLFNRRRSFNNLKNSVEKLLKLGVIPIINENDSISTEEIGHGFGDNDQLSAYVASKIGAEVLILLSDVDGLYDANPRNNKSAERISFVDRVTAEHHNSAKGKGSAFSTGGMETKLKAVEIARDAGCRVILAHGRTPGVVESIFRGEAVGTLFDSAEPMKQRTRWIKYAESQGNLRVDDGALQAIYDKHSLLPRGIIAVEGIFPRGAVVTVNDKIKLVTSFDSSELERIIGQHSDRIPTILGAKSPDVIARPEDMVIPEE